MTDTGFWKDKRLSFIMFTSFIWGIIAHGMAMFVKFSYHDDIPWFNGVGETYGLGRWFLGVEEDLTKLFFGSKNYTTPTFNGALTIAGIGFMIYLICRRLEIEDRKLIAALCGALVCFPSVINIFGCIFTAPQYYVGSVLGVLGAYLYYTYRNIPSFIACTVLMAFSVGVYQSNIPINLMTLLLFMLDIVYRQELKWKEYIILALKNALICICFMGQYFLYNEIALKVKDRVMYDYKGVSSFGVTSPARYLWRLFTAYKRFVKPADFVTYDGVSTNMFPQNIKYFHMLLIVATLVLVVYLLKSVGTFTRMAQIGILLAVSPMFAYFIYLIVDEEHTHGGMGFGESFLFFLSAYIIERVKDTCKVTKITASISVTLMLIIGFMFVRYANVCYLKVQVMQSQAISYYNRLMERIQTTDGYTSETPVVYIGGNSKDESQASVEELFDPIYTPPFQFNSLINDFSWEEAMKFWCGFSPVKGESDDITHPEEIEKMTVYPENGSVRMVDGVLVVKFAD